MHPCYAQYHTFDVLEQIIKDAETVRVLAVLDVDETSEFRGLERYVLVVENDFHFLLSVFVGLRPVFVVLLEDL